MPSKKSSKKGLASSSNLVGLATLWMSALSTDAHSRGVWGTSHGMMRRHHQYHHDGESPVAELVRDFLYTPTFPNSIMRQQGSYFETSTSEAKPQFEISEGEDGTLHLTMEVPGVSARDVNIELENDQVLRVSGIRTRRKNGYTSQTEFEESIRLSSNVDIDNLKVSINSGLLSITIPRKPTKIKKLPVLSDEKSILDPLEKNHNDSDII